MSTAQTIILITGANSGIGYAATSVFVKASSKYHIILASRNIKNGENAMSEIKAMEGVQGTVSTVQLDQDDPTSIKKAAESVRNQFGRVDVLINNAGMLVFNEEEDLKSAMEKTYRTNTVGPALVMGAFKELLMKSENPYSIYVSSGLGSNGLIEEGAWSGIQGLSYRMSKAALNMWGVKEHNNNKGGKLKTFVMCPGLVVSNLRGKTEESRQAGGAATSPVVSGETMLSIVEGKRDADVGKFVHKDGVYPW